mmetsp:Transcript_12585/g.28486  ORF Transcript_12585/g.28486 Transcript_12585/m.28486 type:complete len:1167 (-) Transcript_12585:177-3677(-)
MTKLLVSSIVLNVAFVAYILCSMDWAHGIFNEILAPGLLPGPQPRQLAEVAQEDSEHGSDQNSSDGHSEGGHHQQDALIFLFCALTIGTAVVHISAYYQYLQDTVVLFVVGMFFALTMEIFEVSDSSGLLGDSYVMWMQIDPHLLLFTLLPLLLGGDAMCINTSVAQHVGWQCLYLAGPGVLCGAFATAGFLTMYLGWDFWLCMVTASILCATDPVAVVALLKELGASPTLTVQIQGESLLNDGAAIVLYTIAYDILKGKSYDYALVIEFIVKTAMMACALGVFIGYFFFSWIRAAGSNFHHSSAMIQVSLTLCCAYWSFIMAEGIFKISGVLCCVTASLVLAHHMWPHVASPETMHHVWHTFESLGNIVIFFLAGALTGKAMVDIDAIDYVHLCVIYVVLLVVRFCLIWFSRPLLRRLNKDRIPVSREDALVMTWGGLRGAVGLALAIQVHNDTIQEPSDKITSGEGQRVLFFVGGIAFLTTIVNATTCPLLVQRLGITAMPHAQLRLLKMLCQQLITISGKKGNPHEVTEGLSEVLHEMEEHLLKMPSDPHGPNCMRAQLTVEQKQAQRAASEAAKEAAAVHVAQALAELESDGSCLEDARVSPEGGAGQSSPRVRRKTSLESQQAMVTAGSEVTAEDNSTLIETVRRGEAAYKIWKQKHAKSMLWVANTGGTVSKGIPETHMLAEVDDICELLADTGIDSGMAQVVNKVFLSLVNGHYWKQIECRDLRPGSEEGKILLTSIQVGLSSLHVDLQDFDFIVSRLEAVGEMGESDWWKVFPEEPEEADLMKVQDADVASVQKTGSLIKHVVGSGAFNIFISCAIVLNGLYVALEERWRDDSNDDHLAWLVIEGLFTAVFTLEFFLKFKALGIVYFYSAPNTFDFILVVLGIFGLVTGILERNQGSGGSISDLAGIIRLAKVFRILRFLRIFRLFHAKLSADKEVSVKIAHHMMRVSTFLSFIGAQLQAQLLLVRYFGGNGRIDEVAEAEIGRCILQSQVHVYRAIELCIREESQLEDKELLRDLKWTYERKEITEDLEDFVLLAFKDGAITAREAESIMHPLHKAISACLKKLSDTVEGITNAQRDRSSPSHQLASFLNEVRKGSKQKDEGTDSRTPKKSPTSSTAPPDQLHPPTTVVGRESGGDAGVELAPSTSFDPATRPIEVS